MEHVVSQSALKYIACKNVLKCLLHLDSVPDIEAISPNVQGSPTKPSPSRTSAVAGAHKENSYQNSRVTVNAESGQRRGDELHEVSKGGASKGRGRSFALRKVRVVTIDAHNWTEMEEF